MVVAIGLSVNSVQAEPCGCNDSDDMYAIATETPDATASNDSVDLPPIEIKLGNSAPRQRPRPRPAPMQGSLDVPPIPTPVNIRPTAEEPSPGDIYADELPRHRAMEPMTNPWWDSGWSCRKPIDITETSGGSLTDYQVKIEVDYEPEMQADFDDLRFTNDSGTELDYWIESYAASTDAIVWVEVNDLPVSTTTTIHMYYGNSGVSSASDGIATFIRWDDFDDGYSVGDDPKSARGWTTIIVDATDDVDIQADPEVPGNLVCRIKEGTYTEDAGVYLNNDFWGNSS